MVSSVASERPQETPEEAKKPRRPLHPKDRTFKWLAVVAGAFLVGFVVFVVVQGPSRSSGPSSAALAEGPPTLLAPGTVAPPFSLPGLDGGRPVTLSAFRGEPVVVNFFASWCPDCRAELAALATEARAASGKIAFAGIDTNENSESNAIKLLGEAGATYPVAVDASARVATSYLVEALPVSYFVDSQGKVVGTASGPQTLTSLRRWVDRLEAKR
jgi:thiol-disulfide isomerase/thioredoxin